MTHSDLVKAAAQWLQRKCAVVITELSTIGESADAIGWHGQHSTLIECKVSRSDFFSDQNKFFRREPYMGMGMARYYLTPAGLLKPDDIPPKWGLLELTDCGIRVTKKHEHFAEVNYSQEIGVLLSTLRRIGQTSPTGVSIKAYTYQTKNTATFGMLQEEETNPTPHANHL